MVFEGCPGGAQVEGTRPFKQTGLSPGPVRQLPNTRLLTCKQLKADTRLANCQLQTVELEKTGKPDCQLVIERISKTCNRQFAQYSSQPGGP